MHTLCEYRLRMFLQQEGHRLIIAHLCVVCLFVNRTQMHASVNVKIDSLYIYIYAYVIMYMYILSFDFWIYACVLPDHAQV